MPHFRWEAKNDYDGGGHIKSVPIPHNDGLITFLQGLSEPTFCGVNFV